MLSGPSATASSPSLDGSHNTIGSSVPQSALLTDPMPHSGSTSDASEPLLAAIQPPVTQLCRDCVSVSSSWAAVTVLVPISAKSQSLSPSLSSTADVQFLAHRD